MAATIMTSTMIVAATTSLSPMIVFHATMCRSTCRLSATTLVVTYALHFAGNPFETPGPGLGYVDIYSSKGKLLRRLEHGDWLNAPWGVTLAPLDFGRFSHHLLVSNFSAGRNDAVGGFISAYDLDTGKFDGVLEDATGKPLSINGIWSISFANSAAPNNEQLRS